MNYGKHFNAQELKSFKNQVRNQLQGENVPELDCICQNKFLKLAFRKLIVLVGNWTNLTFTPVTPLGWFLFKQPLKNSLATQFGNTKNKFSCCFPRRHSRLLISPQIDNYSFFEDTQQ